MKNLLLILTIFTLLSCNKDENSTSGSSRIAIKGTISGVHTKSTRSASTEELPLSTAKKVLVFNSNGYELFSINDSAFQAKAFSGTAPALAFLDQDNRFIGCLNAGGINVLPLVSLKDGENTIIDLSSLTLAGKLVIPANNPIGDKIDLNGDEINWYKELGSYYESLSKNIDADDDGVADFMNKKELHLSTIFGINCGKWGLNDVQPQIPDTNSFIVDHTLRVEGGKNFSPQNQTIIFAGPAGSPYSGISQSNYNICPNGNFISFFSQQGLQSFKMGTYTLTIDNKNYTLKYSTVNSRRFFILAEPTIHTNSENKVVSVTVEYRDMNQEPVNAENFVYQTMVQIDGNSRICEMGKLWENPASKQNTEKYTFTLPNPVALSELRQITVSYLDLIGNTYNQRFTK
jgi:hypothetical protein